jgi:hypothetical protein
MPPPLRVGHPLDAQFQVADDDGHADHANARPQVSIRLMYGIRRGHRVPGVVGHY